MKKVIFTMFLVATLVTSCKKEPGFVPVSSDTTTTESTTEVPKQNSDSPEGLTLINGADCASCHKADAKLLGPSWQEIANKYTIADIDVLSTHIIDGSTGIWGELQMTPHPNISTADAHKMVEYILTMKK